MNALLLAVQMLTCIPVAPRRFDAASMRAAPIYLPLVGVALGAVLAAAHAVMMLLLPAPLSAALVVVVSIKLTGGLHQDALADWGDGLGSGRRGAEMLSIMRDPHVGALGTTAVLTDLLIRVACVLSLPASWVGPSLIGSSSFGRAAMLLALLLPPARDAGLGHACAQTHGWRVALSATFGAVAVPAATLGLAAAAAISLGAISLSWTLRSAAVRLGGMNGDVCGAAGTLAETAFLIGAVAAVANASGISP